MIVSEETFYLSLKDAMAQKVRDALEAEIEPACERLRATLREQIGQITLAMMDHYSVRSMGRELIITVRPPSPTGAKDNG